MKLTLLALVCATAIFACSPTKTPEPAKTSEEKPSDGASADPTTPPPVPMDKRRGAIGKCSDEAKPCCCASGPYGECTTEKACGEKEGAKCVDSAAGCK
jgi:hypothetical protein